MFERGAVVRLELVAPRLLAAHVISFRKILACQPWKRESGQGKRDTEIGQ